jgi:hypothetical protein
VKQKLTSRHRHIAALVWCPNDDDSWMMSRGGRKGASSLSQGLYDARPIDLVFVNQNPITGNNSALLTGARFLAHGAGLEAHVGRVVLHALAALVPLQRLPQRLMIWFDFMCVLFVGGGGGASGSVRFGALVREKRKKLPSSDCSRRRGRGRPPRRGSLQVGFKIHVVVS